MRHNEIDEVLDIGFFFAKQKFLNPKNLPKAHTDSETLGDLFSGFLQEASELTQAITYKLDNPTPNTNLDVMLECADVINYACAIIHKIYSENIN